MTLLLPHLPEVLPMAHRQPGRIRRRRAEIQRRQDRSDMGGSLLVMADGEEVSLAVLLAEASRWAVVQDDLESSLRPLVDLAADTVCAFASITQRMDDGTFTTTAASDVRAVRADLLQYRMAEGPSVDASVETEWVVSPAIALDSRWPAWSKKATKIGVHAVFSVHLYTDEAGFGALNLYSPTRRSYTADDHETAALLGAHASVALARFRTPRRRWNRFPDGLSG